MLELGTAKVDITPSFPVPLAGYAIRAGVYERVHTPLFARILCFRPAAGPPVLLVSADLIWWGNEQIRNIQQNIRALPGLEEAAVVLHATHNHSGPQTSETFSPLIGTPSPAYLETLERDVIAGAAEAIRTFEPVETERGAAPCAIGIHRRKLVNGSIRMAPNPDGPNDTECTVIRFRNSSGRTKALLVHFTCHPTTTAENSVSSEFCGVAMSTLESNLGDNAIAAYLQGCCGDIRPELISEAGEFYRGGPEDVQRLAWRLCESIDVILSGPMVPCVSTLCSVSVSEAPLYFEGAGQGSVVSPIPLANARGSEMPILSRDREEAVVNCGGQESSITLEMTRLRMWENLGFLTFNAEMVVEYGLSVKQRSAGAILPVAYSNGMIGYVTTARQLADGGYESREAFRYFGTPGPFAADTEFRVRQAVANV